LLIYFEEQKTLSSTERQECYMESTQLERQLHSSGQYLRWHDPGAVYLLIGSALYLLGSFLVTLVFNVPKNNALASVAPTDPEGTNLWTDYLSKWTAWNHVRAAAALAAATSLTIALC
jgi:uncharacterized membrane protein